MSAEATEKPLIIWVDDDKDYQAAVKEWLLDDYDVITYRDGGELLDDPLDLRADLLILDVRLPGADGFKLCGRIRADRRFRDAPVLFLTSCGDDDSFLRHMDAGGAVFLTKPVGKRRLLEAVASLVDGGRRPRARGPSRRPAAGGRPKATP